MLKKTIFSAIVLSLVFFVFALTPTAYAKSQHNNAVLHSTNFFALGGGCTTQNFANNVRVGSCINNGGGGQNINDDAYATTPVYLPTCEVFIYEYDANSGEQIQWASFGCTSTANQHFGPITDNESGTYYTTTCVGYYTTVEISDCVNSPIMSV